MTKTNIDNCLSLQAARKILEYVRQNDGLLTWYNIVKHIDQLQVEKIPPPYYVLQQLLEDNYLVQDTEKNENSSKYMITQRARQYLGEPVKVLPPQKVYMNKQSAVRVVI